MTLPDAFSLTRLFIAPNAVPAVPTLTQDWVGGVMTAWDAVSFANTVTVGPVTYRNLSVVSPNGLTEGTVLLAKAPGGYLIMGMLGNAKALTFIDPIRYRRLKADLSLPNTTLFDAGVLNFLVNEDTEYAVDGALFINSTTSNDVKFAWAGPPNMVAKWSMFGLNNSATRSILSDTVTGYTDANPQTVQGLGASSTCTPVGWFQTTDTPGLLQLRVALDSGTTAGTLQAGSWLRISELGSGSGATTYVKAYPATGSRSYDTSGNPIGSPDQDNNLYILSLSGRSFGNERHMWTFDAATMRTDLAGATVLSAQMLLYCFASSSSPADYRWAWSTSSSIAGTWPTNGFGGGAATDTFPVGGWAAFDVTGQMVNILSNNANSVLGGPGGFSDSSTGFRGYGFSASYRPYLQISYSL